MGTERRMGAGQELLLWAMYEESKTASGVLDVRSTGIKVHSPQPPFLRQPAVPAIACRATQSASRKGTCRAPAPPSGSSAGPLPWCPAWCPPLVPVVARGSLVAITSLLATPHCCIKAAACRGPPPSLTEPLVDSRGVVARNLTQ